MWFSYYSVYNNYFCVDLHVNIYTVFVLFHSYARLHVAPLSVARLSVAPVNCRPVNCRAIKCRPMKCHRIHIMTCRTSRLTLNL